MSLPLPKPYDDELVYSVFARYFAYAQPQSFHGLALEVNNQAWFSTRFVREAARLAERTQLTWGLTGLQILDRHTLLPFNASFLQPEQHLKCVECFLHENSVGGATALGMANPIVTDPKYLRFCPECLNDDIKRLGETYWRRQHQLTGTLCCLKHGSALCDSSAFLSPVSKVLADATESCDVDAVPSVLLDEREVALARSIADRSARILNGSLTAWVGSDVQMRYRAAAIEIGYGVGVQLLMTKKLGEDLRHHYGQEFLRKLGCRFTDQSIVFRKIFYKDGTSHPLIHVLLQLFMEHRQANVRSLISRQVPDQTFRRQWKCPNKLANHDLAFRIPAVELRRTKQGEPYLHARCPCGYVFNFWAALEDDPSMPLVKRVTGYGEAVKGHIKRRYAECGSLGQVSREIGLGIKTVKRIVDGQLSKYEKTPEIVASLREKWRESGHPFTGSVYNSLLKCDREWVISRPRVNGGFARKQLRVQVNVEKDEALARRVRTAIDALRSNGERVSILGISRVLQQRLDLSRLRLQPSTTEALHLGLDAPNRTVERARELNGLIEQCKL